MAAPTEQERMHTVECACCARPPADTLSHTVADDHHEPMDTSMGPLTFWQDARERLRSGKWLRIALGLAVFGISLVLSLDPQLRLALQTSAYVLVGWDVLGRALGDIRGGRLFNENFLMTVATLGALALGEFPEALAVMLFYEMGSFFEQIAVGHSNRSISALLQLRPDHATLLTADGPRQVNPEQVQVGEWVLIRPGERVPLDGTVVEGSSRLDLSSLTGESVPRRIEAGQPVYAGTTNLSGLLTVEVSKVYGQSTVARIFDLVRNAAARKAPAERFIARFARYYTPVVVLAAAALAVLPPAILPGASWKDWIYRALIFLVVSCPCALVISIPLSFFAGIGAASKRGILFKGSQYLEVMRNVDSVIFDKTGTLTEGVFKVQRIVSHIGDDRDLLELAARAEQHSSHPIARSILDAYGKPVTDKGILEYHEQSGGGIRCRIDGQLVLVGSAEFLDAAGVQAEQPAEIGKAVHVSRDGRYAGYLVIADGVKKDALQAIDELRSLGVRRTVMLTGDDRRIAEPLARELGLDQVETELMPEHKVDRYEEVARQKQTSGSVLFAGDGVNDAPVLARADVGVAMGGLGSQAALETADVVIMTDQPVKIAEAIRLSRRTGAVVRQNIVFALAVKSAVLLLGALGLASMWAAVFADIGVTVLAVLNAMRILRGARS